MYGFWFTITTITMFEDSSAITRKTVSLSHVTHAIATKFVDNPEDETWCTKTWWGAITRNDGVAGVALLGNTAIFTMQFMKLKFYTSTGITGGLESDGLISHELSGGFSCVCKFFGIGFFHARNPQRADGSVNGNRPIKPFASHVGFASVWIAKKKNRLN